MGRYGWAFVIYLGIEVVTGMWFKRGCWVRGQGWMFESGALGWKLLAICSGNGSAKF